MLIEQLGKCNTDEKELLNLLTEECSGVIQSISKVFRFGFDSCHPNTPGWTNRNHLEEELGEMLCFTKLLLDMNVVDIGSVKEHARNKLIKINDYTNIDLSNVQLKDL